VMALLFCSLLFTRVFTTGVAVLHARMYVRLLQSLRAQLRT
jgi:hypothetical protein